MWWLYALHWTKVVDIRRKLYFNQLSYVELLCIRNFSIVFLVSHCEHTHFFLLLFVSSFMLTQSYSHIQTGRIHHTCPKRCGDFEHDSFYLMWNFTFTHTYACIFSLSNFIAYCMLHCWPRCWFMYVRGLNQILYFIHSFE